MAKTKSKYLTSQWGDVAAVACELAGDGPGDSGVAWTGKWYRWTQGNKANLTVVSPPTFGHRSYSGNGERRRCTASYIDVELRCTKKCEK